MYEKSKQQLNLIIFFICPALLPTVPLVFQ